MGQTDRQTSHMARCVTFAVARIRVENRRSFAYFSLWHPKYGRQGSTKAYTGPMTGIYVPTKFGCDRSIVVGCWSRNDRQTDKQNGMTIRLTLCERDATDRQTDRLTDGQTEAFATWLHRRYALVGLPSAGLSFCRTIPCLLLDYSAFTLATCCHTS